MYGFAGDQVEVRGYIELRTTFTDEAGSRTEKIKYLVVNAPSAYNILLGRPTLNRIGAIPSTQHMKVKLPSMEGVVLLLNHQFGRVLLLQTSILHYEGPKPSFYRSKGRSFAYKAYSISYPKDSYTHAPTKLTPQASRIF